jgi:hypothetical protein
MVLGADGVALPAATLAGIAAFVERQDLDQRRRLH